MYLRQHEFTHIGCGTFTKNKKRIQKVKDTGDTRKILQNKLDKACFQLDIIYGDFKDLSRILAPDKRLYDKGFDIAIDPKYNRYHYGLASMVYILFNKNSATCANTSGGAVKSKIMSN